MRIELPKTEQTEQTTAENGYPNVFEVQGRKIYFGRVCGRHMVRAQTEGPKAGAVELGYRTLAILLSESMGDKAFTYRELLDMPTSELTEVLNALN